MKNNRSRRNKRSLILKGHVASGGIACGTAVIVDRPKLHIPKYWIHDAQAPAEIARFKRSLQSVKKELESLKQKLCRIDGQEQITILDSHLMMINDPAILQEVFHRIERDKINAEWAYEQAIAHVETLFSQVYDTYFYERKSDLNALAERVLKHLLGESSGFQTPSREGIIVARELTPVQTIELAKFQPLAFVTELGGRNGHVAIVARSLSVPCIVGIEHILDQIKPGDELIVDGEQEQVFVNPKAPLKRRYASAAKSQRKQRVFLLKHSKARAMTRDQQELHILANVEWIDDLKQVKSYGPEGVGLFRTEYLFLGRDVLPDEEFQFSHYKRLVSAFPKQSVTVRALDIGGDKVLDPTYTPELNPALGVRGIRYCFREREIFHTQLRALLRASAYGEMRFLFSMVNSLEELRQIKQALARARKELEEEKIPCADDVPVGIMVETPAAALTMDLFEKEADFFSVGTNDLTQYTLAVDRDNDDVGYLYDPLHPSLLRLLWAVVEGARAANKPLSICGELAGDPFYLYFLVGIGFRELSMNPVSIPKVKYLLHHMDAGMARAFVSNLLSCKTAKDVNRAMVKELSGLFPKWFHAETHSFRNLSLHS